MDLRVAIEFKMFAISVFSHSAHNITLRKKAIDYEWLIGNTSICVGRYLKIMVIFVEFLSPVKSDNCKCTRSQILCAHIDRHDQDHVLIHYNIQTIQ